MGYLTTLAIVFIAIWCCFFLLLFHYGVFALIGVFKRTVYPHTERRLKYGIVIAARNEEAVIGPLLDSIWACDYPREKLEVFVVAHNCTDRTAAIARARGAQVYEYDNPAERTAGYAYRCLFDKINCLFSASHTWERQHAYANHIRIKSLTVIHHLIKFRFQ